MNIINIKKRIYTAFALLLIVILIFKFNFLLLFFLLTFGVLSAIEFFNITEKIIRNRILKLIQNITLFYSYLFLSYFLFFDQDSSQNNFIYFTFWLHCFYQA